MTHLREYPDACPACGCGLFYAGECRHCGREVKCDRLIAGGGTRQPTWGSSKVGGLAAHRVGPLNTEWEFNVEQRRRPEERHVRDLPPEHVAEDEEPRYLVEVQVGMLYPTGGGQSKPGLRTAYADPRLEDVVVRRPLAVTDPESDLSVRPIDEDELPGVIGAKPGTGGRVEDVTRLREWAATLHDCRANEYTLSADAKRAPEIRRTWTETAEVHLE